MDKTTENGFDKLKIADEIMESAIESYLDQKRYFVALNLAGVAQEIYGKWIRINGGKDLPSQSLDNLEKIHTMSGDEFNRKKFVRLGNSAKNTIKHFDNANDRYATLEPHFDSYLQLIEAFVEHNRLKRPTTNNIIKLEEYIKQTKEQGTLRPKSR